MHQYNLTARLGAGVRNLTSMEVKVSYFIRSDSPAERHERIRQFGKFLNEAQNLQNLTLHKTMAYDFFEEDKLTDFLEVPTPNLPALKDLHLHGFCTTKRSLSAFLTRFQGTLRNLTFERHGS